MDQKFRRMTKIASRHLEWKPVERLNVLYLHI